MYVKSPRGLRTTWGPDGAPIRDPYAVRVLWTRGLPSYGIDECPHEVEGGLRIGAVLLGEFAYCPKYYGWTFLGGLGEGSLCGHVVEGFLALFCGGSLGGPSAACCGYASWLACWRISGASMGIPSSLLSISGLEAWCYEARRFASRCLARVRGAPFEGSVRPMFGVICLCWSWRMPWGSWCFGVFPRLGWTPGAGSPGVVFFLRSWLRGVRWRQRRTTKRCRRRSMLFCCGVFGGVSGAFGWCW